MSCWMFLLENHFFGITSLDSLALTSQQAHELLAGVQ